MAQDPVAIKVDSSDLIGYLERLPEAIMQGMRASARKAGTKFLAVHRERRLSGEKVTAAGKLVATGRARKVGEPSAAGFISRRIINIQGDREDNLTLTMRVVGLAKFFERGRILEAGEEPFPVPLDAAKDSRGKVTRAARELLRLTPHANRAGSQGFNLHRQKGKRTERIRGLVRFRAQSGKIFLAKINPRRKGKGRLTLMFHLEPRIRIRPRLQFLDTWRRFRPEAVEIYRQALPFAIKAAKRKLSRSFAAPGEVVR